MSEPVSLGLSVGVELLTKVAPTGLAWLSTKFFGVNLLVLGERRSGKSSFANYFEYGVLLPQGTTTPRTLKERDTASFVIATGRDKSLRMHVRRVTDTVGHATIKEQIDLISRRCPHILMVFVDISRDWDIEDDDFGSRYLSLFLEELNSRSARVSKISSKLKHMCIVLNKVDLVAKDVVKKKNEEIKRLLSGFRSPNWGGSAAAVAVYPCVAIEHSGATEILDEILKKIILAVVLESR
jgi:hypothetical protein